ncbi:MAG: HD domain-containing protein [Clostridiales bacterium]|nr:HD domain-containing protein [Clostridiales bacterium]
MSKNKRYRLALHFAKRITEYKLAKELFTRGKDIILSPEAQVLKTFTQHGETTVFEHCLSVAKFSLLMAHFLERTLKIDIDKDSLVRGALLHDYFLYDWHDKAVKGRRVHGFTHPGTAKRNAERDFGLNDLERDIISKHMFPVTPFPPMHRESVIVNLADKWCALCETLKLDVSSYIIYRVNFNIALAEGEYSIDYGETKAEY